jgi:hypothetical protein
MEITTMTMKRHHPTNSQDEMLMSAEFRHLPQRAVATVAL